MKRKHIHRMYVNRLIASTAMFMRAYKLHKMVFLIPGTAEKGEDIIKAYKAIKDHRTNDTIDYLYNKKGFINDFMYNGNVSVYVGTDLTPKKINRLTKKLMRMVKEYE